ncbi:MAG: hypothetical protein AAFV59_09425 [Pseudomonadota bacterium]
MFMRAFPQGILAAFFVSVLGVSACTRAVTANSGTEVITALEAPVQRASNSPMDHSHMPVLLPDGIPVPTLSIVITRDWMSGLNLEILTENYVMDAPPSTLDMSVLMQPSINHETGFAEGHAHLYVNGIKIQRVYGNHVHLPDSLFKPGLNQINVSINNHGHMYWMANGRQIIATLYIDLDQDNLVKHRFESYPAMKAADGSLCTTERMSQEG